MIERANIRLIAFVGMPGAGKTEAVNYLVQQGWPRIYMGGILYDEMNKAGAEVTPESQQIFREELRAREGKDYIARIALQNIRNLLEAGQKNIVIDGVYSWTEYRTFKHEYHQMEAVAIVAPRSLRHRRLASRPERPFTPQQAMTRDFTEIENMEKGGPIAVADHYIINDGSLEDLHRKIDAIMEGAFAE